MNPQTLKERQAISWVTMTTLNNSSVNTAGLNMGIIRRARAFFSLGTLTSTASVNISLQASATSGGTYSSIPGSPAFSVVPSVTGIVTDDCLNAIEISADLMPAGKPWLRAIATETASQNAVVSILLIGDDTAYKPGRDYSVTTLTNDVVAFV